MIWENVDTRQRLCFRQQAILQGALAAGKGGFLAVHGERHSVGGAPRSAAETRSSAQGLASTAAARSVVADSSSLLRWDGMPDVPRQSRSIRPQKFIIQ